jgi:pSer/pThr/pTyr-binding forkhead associated (FHA) protein
MNAQGSPQPSPRPQPNQRANDGTLILDRGPKLPVEALLINRQANVNYSLNQPSVAVGRTPENDIQLESDRISRRHALVRFENHVFYVHDLGSSNGTFVNDVRVQGQQALQDGDVVRFGDLVFIFKILS